nr:accessory gene regulator B family protein [Ruminococcus bromii]
MIKLISSKVARILCEDEKHTDNYELYEYAIYILLSSAFHIATVIVLGLVFNLLTESLVFYLSFIAIRKFAGGYHAKTPVRCYMFSIILYIVSLALIGFICESQYCVIITIILELFYLVCIFAISPLDSNKHPLNLREKRVYRIISFTSSIVLFLLSLMLLFELKEIGIAVGLGIILVAFVLLIRKIQIIVDQNIGGR